MNIVSDYLDFAKTSIIGYLKLFFDKYYNREISNLLVDRYIGIRYYNYCDIKYHNVENNIIYCIKDYCENNLFNLYPDDKDYILVTSFLLRYIYLLDVVDGNITKYLEEINSVRKNKYGLDDLDFVMTMYNYVKGCTDRKKEFFKKVSTDKFFVKYKRTNNKKVHFADLVCNLNFPKIYSQYSIDRVYNNGLVYEDKMFVLYNLLSIKLITNCIESEFDNYYLIDFPYSMISKHEKTNRLLSIFDDDLCKNSIVFKITYTDYLKYKEFINECIKKSYRFACIIDDNFEYESDNLIWLNIFEFVILDKEMRFNYDKDKIIISK